MKCFRKDCNKAAPLFTLYRVNQKGIPGVWSCKEHRLEKDSELDAIIESLKNNKGNRQIA